MNTYLDIKQKDFQAALDFFKKEISVLRTGQANPSILDDVRVEAYEIQNPVNAVANISISDGRSIIIAPWDRNILKNIEKAIIASDLGLGVVNEGDKLRLTVPPLTEENRKELVKKLNEKMEKARVSLRSMRDQVKNAIEEAEEKKEISEDDKFRFVKELDEFSAKKNEELKELRDRKEKDIMAI